MIKLLPFLLLFSLVYGKNIDYLLPDDNERMSYTLNQALKHSQKEILILTPSFNHTPFVRAALDALKRGSRLILVVQNVKGDPLSLAQYERVDVRILNARLLEGSVIFVDDKLVCTLPGGIDAENFSNHASLIRCSDDEASIAALHTTLLPLLKRSESYLK